MTQPARPSRRRIVVAAAAAAAVAAVPAALIVLPAGAADAATTDPTFTRYNVDTAVSGAGFTSVGTVFAGEQDILTSG